jgi:hypothetical protein
MTRQCRKANYWLQSVLLLACFATGAMHAQLADAKSADWKVEQDVRPPGYAVAEPTATNLNIESVVLACEEGKEGRIMQLQLSLSDEGPLRSIDAFPRQLKDDPQAEITIDGRVFAVALLYADDYVMLADNREGPFPQLSNRLIDAMQVGKTMTLRFDLIAEAPDRLASYGGEAIVDLQASGAGEAIAAVRRCVELAGRHQSGTTWPRQ